MLKLRKRRGRRNWYIRGTVRGQRVDESTGTSSRDHAQYLLTNRQAELLDRSIYGPRHASTFPVAVNAYLAASAPSRNQARYIARLLAHFGTMPLHRLDQAQYDAAAIALYPQASPETRNRQVYTPIAAILHHAARCGLCEWTRIQRPKQRKPRNRPASMDAAAALLASTGGPKHALLATLFYTGCRISEALSLTVEQIDLPRRWIVFDVTKTDEDGGAAMHEDLFLALANMPLPAAGFVYPWRTRGGVYKWLRPLCRDLGVKFTPHMARHSYATWLRQAGHDLGKIKKAGRWKDEKSVARYTHVEDSEVREAVASLPSIVQMRAAK